MLGVPPTLCPQVQQNIGYALPVIRGLGSVGSGAGMEPPIAFYVDGVYYGAALSNIFSFNNIERVEVLKGPQGTLFGRNATGGLIQIVTKDPKDSLGIEARMGYGNYQTVSGSLYVTGPVADNLSADLAFQGTHMGEGYGKNLVTGNDVNQINHDISVRSKWMWSQGGTTARLSLDYSDIDNSMSGQRLVEGTATPPPFLATDGGGKWDISHNEDPSLRIKTGGVTLKVNHEFNAVELVSISAYRKTDFDLGYDYDYGPVLGRSVRMHQKDKQFSQELQLLSRGSGPFSWVLGGYYYNAESSYKPPVEIAYFGGAAPPLGNKLINGAKLGTESIAGFAQGTYKLFDRLGFTAGLRYTHEKKSLEDAFSYFIRPDGTINTVAGNVVVPDTSSTVNKLTWRLALDFQMTDDLLAYVSYNRGFKSGGYNGVALTVPPFRPESIDAYEVGFKSTLLDRRVRFNGAFYYYDYKDVQVKLQVATGTATYNGPSAEIYGVDLDLEVKPTDNLYMKFGYQYAHGKYKDFTGALFAQQAPLGYYLVTPGDASGNRTVLTPKHTLAASAFYDIDLGPSKLTLNGSYYYNSGYFTEPDNLLKQKSYNLVNASVKWTGPNENVSVTVWGQNLTNTAVANVLGMQLTSQAAPYNALARVSYAPPRTYGVTLGFKY